tara:strand:+ start:503 stop:1417 length:915 start_codon:yes stop_codon:yes gene_type:complete
MSKYNLIDIFEGMTDKEFSDSQEKDRLEAHPEKDMIKKIKNLMSKEKKEVKEGDAVDLAIEVSQKKAGIKEDQYDDITDADDDIPADKKKEAALAYRKVDKGASYEKATSHIKEVRIDSEVADRIEGLTNRELKRKFLFAFEDLYSDLIEEDPFHAEDVINHLNNEMHKHLSSFQNTGDKFAGMEESFDSLAKKLDKQKGIDKDEAAKIAGSIAAKKAAGAGKGPTAKQKKRMSEGILKDVVLAIIKDTNATNPEVQAYIDSLTNDIKLNGKEAYADYEIDDYIEDFKNYIADKSLQEHFKRFK